MMWYKHVYRVIKSSWGIYIEINAGYERYSTSIYKNKSENIDNGIYIYNMKLPWPQSCSILDTEWEFLKYGLRLVSKKIKKNSPFKDDTLILLKTILFNECNFQIEGMTIAIMEWASLIFNFDIPKIEAEFDRSKNKYIFDFKNVII